MENLITEGKLEVKPMLHLDGYYYLPAYFLTEDELERAGRT